jgi:hypothetical protein
LTLLKAFIYQDDIVEYSCRIIKYSQRTLGNQYLPFLHTFLQATMLAYQTNQIGSLIYSLEFSLREFGHQPQHYDMFTEALDHVITVSHGYLVSREVCEQQPDLINDIFGMAMQFVRQNKSLFFSSSQLESLI